jgi:hypothetical protein
MLDFEEFKKRVIEDINNASAVLFTISCIYLLYGFFQDDFMPICTTSLLFIAISVITFTFTAKVNKDSCS